MDIDNILRKFEYDASVEAFESSPMIKMLKERDSEDISIDEVKYI
jgi:cobalamin biosynthesis Co2+ chelatase CbiK